MLTVSTYDILTKLPIHNDGELALVEEERKIYHYVTDSGWEPIKIEGNGLQLSLYEINQNIFAQLDPMPEEDLDIKRRELIKFTNQDCFYNAKYFSLMCLDRRYVTIFSMSELTIPKREFLIDELFSLMRELGSIKDIAIVNDHVEIWITDVEDNTDCYLFFNYTNGVIEI